MLLVAVYGLILVAIARITLVENTSVHKQWSLGRVGLDWASSPGLPSQTIRLFDNKQDQRCIAMITSKKSCFVYCQLAW